MFSRHFLENRERGIHQEATDEQITEALGGPDYIQPPEGNRTVYWKRIMEPQGEWWLLLVISGEGEAQVLSAYENSEKGTRLWEMQ